MTADATETEDTTETEAPENEQAEAVGEKPTAPDRLPDDHPVVKALAKANKEAEAARLKVKEFEDRDKTEEQRLKDRIAELEPSAKETARLRVALEKGLTATQAKRLVGDNEEELSADADQLLEDLGTKPKVPARPKGPDDGGKPSDSSPGDMSKLADSILGSGL